MSIFFNRRPKKQHWLKIESTHLVLFETGTYTGGLPYINILASNQVTDALSKPEQYVQWVKKYANTTLNLLIAEDLYQLILSDMPDVPAAEMVPAMELKAAELLNYDIES